MNQLMSTLKDRFILLSGKKRETLSLLAKEEEKKAEALKELLKINKAIWVLTEVQQETHEGIKQSIEPLVTKVVRSIYDKPYTFELLFEKKGNVMTCRPVLKLNGKELDPMDDLGGGVVDVVTFSTRLVLWSMETPSTNPIIWLDEPLKNMGELISLGAIALRKVCDGLNAQLIVNTHSDEIALVADRHYSVFNDGKESKLKLIRSEDDSSK